jgi:hypothetical protein
MICTQLKRQIYIPQSQTTFKPSITIEFNSNQLIFWRLERIQEAELCSGLVTPLHIPHFWRDATLQVVAKDMENTKLLNEADMYMT